MQENSFTHITTGIVQVIDTEEKLLSSLSHKGETGRIAPSSRFSVT